MSIITREQAIEAYEASEKYSTKAAAANSLGISREALNRRISRYYADPEAIVYRNCQENRVPFEDVNLAWIKNDEVSMLWKNNSNNLSYFDVRDSLIEEMKKYSPVYQPKYYDDHVEDNLLVVDAADVHVGKLSRKYETGYDYDSNLAVARMEEGITKLTKKALHFGISKIVFVVGNDILHTDNPRRTTTSGTPQDTDGQWWEMYLAAKMAYIKAIEALSQIAPVHVVFCPSNHDYVSGWMLADTLSSWFNKNQSVSFGEDNQSVSIAHRKYIVYGANLIGFTHGDGAKEKDLPNLMQYEAREMWGKTKYAYMYTHHTHHKDRKQIDRLVEKDHIGMTVLAPSSVQTPEHSVYIETVRSPSPADAWHSRNGYVNKCAIEAFIHHIHEGQIARLTQYF